MAEFGPQFTLAEEAAVDLSGKQYHFVRYSAANKVNQASEAVHSSMAGVLQNKPKSGDHAEFAILGRTKITAGGALTVNDMITTNGSGRAAKVASGQMAGGRVLEASGADGDVVSALLFPPTRWSGAIFC